MLAPLAGRTAVVTGASSGIGRAIAEAFGAEHAHVVLAGAAIAPMEDSVERIAAAGGTAEAHVVNVRVPEEVAVLVADAASSTGRLDVMVNNAGVSYPEPITSADPEHWREMLETNVLGLLAGCQAAVRAMRRRRRAGTSSTSRRSQRTDRTRASTAPPSTLSTASRTRCAGADRRPDPGRDRHARSHRDELRPELRPCGAERVGLRCGHRTGRGDPRHADPGRGPRAAQSSLPEHLCTPVDVADAVVFAVTRRPGRTSARSSSGRTRTSTSNERPTWATVRPGVGLPASAARDLWRPLAL